MRTRSLSAVVAMAVIVVGCSAAASSPANSKGTPASTPANTPTKIPTPTPDPTPAGFSLEILPAEEPVAARVAIPGEKVNFLVVVKDQGSSGLPVKISATAKGATITAITPSLLRPGVVGEVWVVPDASTVETVVDVAFTATRDGITLTDKRTVAVWPMKDERAKDAKPYFDRWAGWLATSHPELGITAATKWQPTFVSTFLVVSHYAYYSEDWEMEVSWHNMIQPYDWTEVYLRHRGDDAKPSLAFRIDSVSGKTAPHAVTPPDAVMR